MEVKLNKNNIYEETLLEISNLIKGSNFENHVFLVGGAVRDLLMGRQIHDIDIAVDLENGGIEFSEWLCKEIGAYKEGSNPVIFPNFGTSKFNLRTIHKLSKIDIECVQTRKEQYHDPNSRNPSVTFGTITEDAFRRDLTINALYINLSNMTELDPTKMGLKDLNDCILRTPSKADVIYFEDPLRMLRTIRFKSRFGWGIEKETWFGIVKNAFRINTISQERITDEINKILISPRPSLGIRQLYNCGLLDKVLPEVYNLIGCEQGEQHFGDVFEHTMMALEFTQPSLHNRLGILFHDIEKPNCKTTINGKIHFFSHEYSGALKTKSIMQRMKYSNDDIDAVTMCVKNHMRFKQSGNNCPSNKSLRKFMADMKTNENMAMVLDVINADNNAHKPEYCALSQVNKILSKLIELMGEGKEEKVTKVVLPINGHDIMERFNLKKGPKIGNYLEIVKDNYFDNPDITREECFAIIQSKIEAEAHI